MAFAALVASALLLTLVWISLSVLGGDGGRVAEAQTAGDEPGGAVQSGGDAGNLPDNDPDYAAFGEERNPFNPVLSQASEDNGGGTTEDDSGGDSAGGAQEDSTGGGSTGGENTTGGGGADGAGDQGSNKRGGTNGGAGGGGGGAGGSTRTPADDDTSRNDIVTAPNGQRVDCGNPADEFERIICEEERGGGGSDGAAAGQTGSGGSQGQQGPPGSGGSGRSGAGEQTDDFRNGGGGVSK